MKKLPTWQKPTIVVDPIPTIAIAPISKFKGYVVASVDPANHLVDPSFLSECLTGCFAMFSADKLLENSFNKVLDDPSTSWWLYGAYHDSKEPIQLDNRNPFCDHYPNEQGIMLFGNYPQKNKTAHDFVEHFLTRIHKQNSKHEEEKTAIEKLQEILKAEGEEQQKLCRRFIYENPPGQSSEPHDLVQTIRDQLVRINSIPNYESRDFELWCDWDEFISPWPTSPAETPDLFELVEKFPLGHLIRDVDFQKVTIQQAVENYLATTTHTLSRNNTYAVLPINTTQEKNHIDAVVVTWEPHGDKTPYLHMRGSVECLLPSAVSPARSSSQSPPHFPNLKSEQVQSGWPPPNPDDLADDFEIRPPEDSYRNRDELAERSKTQIKKTGMEALGWYQPWHRYSEDSWGIYLHTNNLDDFSMMIRNEAAGKAEEHYRYRRDNVFIPLELAALLAYTNVYYHELFHARFEACATAIELTSNKACYIKYFKDVYQKHFCKNTCYEELLANFFTHKKTHEYVNSLPSKFDSAAGFILQALETAMDMSPPGYRDWRNGEELLIQRQLITSLRDSSFNDNPEPPALESLLNAAMPVDFETEDIPIYLYGNGWTSKVFDSMPACLNTVSRKELRCALKHFDYQEERGRGKGSHELWKKQQILFPLPYRDPVSGTVFRSFLNQNNLSKHEYLKLRSKF